MLVVAGVSALFVIIGTIVAFRLVRRQLVSVSAMPPPYTHRDVSEMLKQRLDAFDPARIAAQNPGNKHANMAAVRYMVEKACYHVLGCLSGAGGYLRDVGGSLTRNRALGKRLHICFPNLSGADKRKLAENPTPANDVGHHRGQDCPHSNRPTMMTYVDFHMSIDELVQAIRSPTLILTHDFSKVVGSESWFEGEAHVERIGDMISMSTEGGSRYFHGFHSWGDEGTAVTTSGAFSYQRVYDDHHSIVLWCVPLSGKFIPSRDNTLASSAGHCTRFPLSNGVTATLDADNYNISRPDGTSERVSASTITRVAFQMAGALRDAKWGESLNSILRGRFVADKQPMTCLIEAQQLCVRLADTYALTLERSLVGDPAQYGFLWRNVLRVFLAFTRLLPTSLTGLGSTLVRYLLEAVGGRTTNVSWMWSHIKVPTYEVFWDQVMSSRSGDTRRPPKQRGGR